MRPSCAGRTIRAVLLVALLARCSEDRTSVSSPWPAPDGAAAAVVAGEVLVGAGNIARCDRQNDEATARLLDTLPGTVFTAGSNVNTSGSLDDFTSCYGPSWGRHQSRTRPAAGVKEYLTPGASGYFTYFGSAAGDTGKGYYSYDLGAWHIMVLNSSIAMSAGSPQEQWLRAELASNTKRCTLAYWYYPRFSSSGTNVRSSVKPLWSALYASRADLVVNAHYRVYERFAPQTPDQVPDNNGIRQFTVGTGGQGADTFSAPIANSEVRSSGAYGVLKLTLGAGTYAWEFVPVAAGGFTDSGTGSCHSTASGIPVSSVGVDPASASVVAGATVALTATPQDADGNPLSGRVVTWASDAPAVASVRGSGLVTGLTPGTATITATSEGKSGSSGVTVTAPPPGSPMVLVGAGDIATCSGTTDEATASMLDGISGTVITIGDNVYENGTSAEYAGCYDPSWGRHKARTRPVPGNHDYNTPGATGYYGYFGAAAGDPAKGYYSYDVGEWHLVALNSEISTSVGSPQEQWLRADLGASSRRCTLAYWHKPRFSSGVHGSSTATQPLWEALYEAGSEVVLVGHDHDYERFGPQLADGTPDGVYGMREFVVGTGGASHSGYGFGTVVANSEVRNGAAFGVLKLTLSADGYQWAFVPVSGQTFADSGSGSCHDIPPNRPPVARPGGPYTGEATIQFNASASSDLEGNLPLSFAWDFGDGATGSGATPTHTYSAFGTYPVTLTATDSKGAASAPARTTVTIANVAPLVNAGSDASLRPGATFGLRAAFRDPGTDAPWTYTITWGDGAQDGGSTTTQLDAITAGHAYATVGQYSVRVTVTDANGGAGSDEAVVTVAQVIEPQVLVGAGQIARCDLANDEATASLLDGIPGTVFALGDNVRVSGSVADFTACYDPSWGRHKARTRPAVGELEYQTAGASGYFDYFWPAAGDPNKGYYSYELGDWHIVVLNSNISMSVGSPQEQWLRADLAASGKRCTLAYWHHPRFSSYGTTVRTAIKPLWDALYAAGAELVVNAHYRLYERFAPQTPNEGADPQNGIRQFTVGTGGQGIEFFGTTFRPNSEVRNSGAYGVLKLTLATDSYSWDFVPIAGQTFRDSGSGSCH